MRWPEEVAHLLELYKQVPVETAKRSMRFWAIHQQSLNESEPAAPAPAET